MVLKPELGVALLREQIEATRALSQGSAASAGQRWQEHVELVLLGNALTHLGELAEAVELYGQAAAIVKGLREADPGARQLPEALGNILILMANMEMQLNRTDEATRHYGEAVDHLTARIELAPEDAAAARVTRSQAQVGHCNAIFALGRVAEAVPVCERALEFSYDLPQTAGRDYTLATQAFFVGRLKLQAGEVDAGIAELEGAIGLWDELIAVSPLGAYYAGRADALNMLALVDPGICWQVVDRAWQAAAERGPLLPNPRYLHDYAVQAAEADPACEQPEAAPDPVV
jgi:tetratricopeptide (TPR) repeat protein